MEVCECLQHTSGTRRDGPRDMKLFLEAVLKRARATKHPWLVACDANMCPVECEKSLWFRKGRMNVIAPEGVSACSSKSAQGEWVEKVYDIHHCLSTASKGRLSLMKVVEVFESRPHKAESFVVEREKEVQEWNEQKMPKVLPGHSGGRLPGRSTKEGGREEEEAEEACREGQVRKEIVQEVVESIKEKASAHVDAKSSVQRTVGQSVKQKGTRWKCNGLSRQSWKRFLEGRRAEGVSLHAEVWQKVPELVVHERMSQCKKSERHRRKEESARMVDGGDEE